MSNKISFTHYNASKYILHTAEGKHFLINYDKKIEIEKILESDNPILQEKMINKINNLKNLNKNNLMFFSDFQFRMPILSKENIRYLTTFVRFLFNKYVLSFLIGLILFILPYLYFVHTIYENVVININSSWFIFLLVFLFHEIGHATACIKYGANPGEIGFGITSYLPVLYADVTDSWRLKRHQRMVVNFSGVYFQNIISLILVTVSWFNNSPQLFFIAKTIFIASLFQFFPFYKSDGYWILSDIFSEPNLYRKARNAFYKKIGQPSTKTDRNNWLIIIYYVVVSSIINYFIIKMGIKYYDYIIDIPFYLYSICLKISELEFNNLNINVQYLWASVYLFFTIKMFSNNLKEFILSKRG